jgi:calcineurin-like phosphoesterase family protein
MITTNDIETKRIWVTSDLHFGHDNITHFAIFGRPGVDILGNNHDYDLHNQEIVNNHNAVVNDNDIVLNLGDISFRRYGVERWASQLKGKHYFIRGNHDSKDTVAALAELGWTQLEEFSLVIPEGTIAFTHKPIKNLPPKCFNAHGHTHTSPYEGGSKHLNLSVDVTWGRPVLLARVIEQAHFALGKNNSEMDFDRNEHQILARLKKNQVNVETWRDPDTGVPPKRRKYNHSGGAKYSN